jgi:hypothetical protein
MQYIITAFCKLKRILMKKVYKKVALDFILDGEPVTGELDGDYHYWTFTSQSSAFLHYVPSGVLESSAGWKGPIPNEIHSIYKSIWTAAEMKGYEFNGR